MKYHPYRLNRRDFMKMMGLTTAGVFFSYSGLARPMRKLAQYGGRDYLAQVAATENDNYDPIIIKQKVEHVFDALGGIGDVVGPGDKVGIKLNLTGGSAHVNDPNLQGVDIREAVWTHPEVLRAVTECIIDEGVSPSDIYFVEALWDWECYNDWGYLDVQQALGTQMVNLNEAAPYPSFANISTGPDHFFYSSFILNQILGEIDVYVSLPKMKHHYEAATTQSMKNQVGSVPLQFYQLAGQTGYRSAIHFEGGPIEQHLPRSIVDLNLARPVHLAVIDGIKNATGGEGPWNPTFSPAENHLLLAGKDPVATDSIATWVMGLNPEQPQLVKPNGMMCDNYLYLANSIGMGTNILEEIEVVGDGAGVILGVDENGMAGNNGSPIRLLPNYPNPFRTSTTFRFYLAESGLVTLTLLDASGKELITLLSKNLPAGEHQFHYNANGLPGGVYFCNLKNGKHSVSRKIMKE